MSNSAKNGFLPAVILQVDPPQYPRTLYTIHIAAVYGGGNSLRFRCPCCGAIHTHGAGDIGGASDGATPSPHCGGDYPDYPHFWQKGNFQWCLHELTEDMDISRAGDLAKIRKYICPRRRGKAGYDQLKNGRIDYSASPSKLIKAYKAKGGKHE